MSSHILLCCLNLYVSAKVFLGSAFSNFSNKKQTTLYDLARAGIVNIYCLHDRESNIFGNEKTGVVQFFSFDKLTKYEESTGLLTSYNIFFLLVKVINKNPRKSWPMEVMTKLISP